MRKLFHKMANARMLIAAWAALLVFAVVPAQAAKSYRFVIELALSECRANCYVGAIRSTNKMSKTECEKILPEVKKVARKNGMKIKSARCFRVR
jgi:hypothetical protein